MANVVRKDIDPLNAQLIIQITKEDWEPKFKKELKKEAKEVHIKGFRKGKAPISYLKKLYGRTILTQIVNKELQDALNNYLREEKSNILGQPIFSENQKTFDFDPDISQDFEFQFDIGRYPQVPIIEDLETISFPYYEIKVYEDAVDRVLMGIRKREGTPEDVSENIQNLDMVYFDAVEINPDKEEEKLWKTSFGVLVGDDLTDTLKESLLGKNKGDKININLYNVEKNKSEDFVIKHFFNTKSKEDIQNVAPDFEATIVQISRMKIAELNQAFFDKIFEEEDNVSSEEDARAILRKDLKRALESDSQDLLSAFIKHWLLENIQIPLPEDFLMRWLEYNKDDEEEDISDIDFFQAAQGLRWSMIKTAYAQHFNIVITEGDIFEEMKNHIRSFFGSSIDELVVLNTANRLMEEEKQVERTFHQLLEIEVFDKIKQAVTLEKHQIDEKEFADIRTKKYEELQTLLGIAWNNANLSEQDTNEDANFEEDGIEDITEDFTEEIIEDID